MNNLAYNKNKQNYIIDYGRDNEKTSGQLYR